MRIVVLSGGTGTPKLLEGLIQLVSPEKLTIICNTGDDWSFYSMHVSPDLDSVIYNLVGLLDRSKYYGIIDDTTNIVKILQDLGEDVWFKLGDKDAGICLLRTHLINKGHSLTETTRKITSKFGIQATILPMTDSNVETWVESSKGHIHLQEYWIREKGLPDILNVYYKNSSEAVPAPGVCEAIKNAKLVIVGPSNPISSIGPIIAIPGIRKALEATSAVRVGVSPIIGKKAFSGPAAVFMKAQGVEVSSIGVADYYNNLLDYLFVDETESDLAGTNVGTVKFVPVNTVMKTDKQKLRLAKEILKFVDKTS